VSLEDNDGAKKLLYRATDCVPHSTELWLALAKLEAYDEAKNVLNNAISAIPTDHSIWISAAKLEEA
jgi:pre-mRNA-processing factor 6